MNNNANNNPQRYNPANQPQQQRPVPDQAGQKPMQGSRGIKSNQEASPEGNTSQDQNSFKNRNNAYVQPLRNENGGNVPGQQNQVPKKPDNAGPNGLPEYGDKPEDLPTVKGKKLEGKSRYAADHQAEDQPSTCG